MTNSMHNYRGTTIVSYRDRQQVVIGGDGQVTLGNTVMKANARKVRRLYHNQVLAGFAGATADAFTLFEIFEAKKVESFTHGSSEQRVKWLNRGLKTGSYDACNTFSEGV